MQIYFADTSFWIALVDSRDVHHATAARWSASISGSIVTTDAVMIETANAFSRPNWREKVIALINHILLRDDIEIVAVPWSQGWKLFATRPDKAWSLTDCISFEIMQQRGIETALAADSHFQQAGFRALLLEPQSP